MGQGEKRRDGRERPVERPSLHQVGSGRMAESSTWMCSRPISWWIRIPLVPSKHATRLCVSRNRRNSASRKQSPPRPSCRAVAPTSGPYTDRSCDRFRGVRRTTVPTATAFVMSLRSHVRRMDWTRIHCTFSLSSIRRQSGQYCSSRVPDDSPPSVENLAGKFPRTALRLRLSKIRTHTDRDGVLASGRVAFRLPELHGCVVLVCTFLPLRACAGAAKANSRRANIRVSGRVCVIVRVAL